MNLTELAATLPYCFTRDLVFRRIAPADAGALATSVSLFSRSAATGSGMNADLARLIVDESCAEDARGRSCTLSIWSRRRARWLGLVQFASQGDDAGAPLAWRMRGAAPLAPARAASLVLGTLSVGARLLAGCRLQVRVADAAGLSLLTSVVGAGALTVLHDPGGRMSIGLSIDGLGDRLDRLSSDLRSPAREVPQGLATLASVHRALLAGQDRPAAAARS